MTANATGALNENDESRAPGGGARPTQGRDQNEATTATEEPLGALLKAITAGCRQQASAERDGILADYARRMAGARASGDPDLAGMLRTLAAARAAALAIVARNAQREGNERRQTLIAARPGRRPRSKARTLSL